MIFRLHYTDGTTLDIDADTPDAARKKAAAIRDGIVKKIKVVKERVDG